MREINVKTAVNIINCTAVNTVKDYLLEVVIVSRGQQKCIRLSG